MDKGEWKRGVRIAQAVLAQGQGVSSANTAQARRGCEVQQICCTERMSRAQVEEPAPATGCRGVPIPAPVAVTPLQPGGPDARAAAAMDSPPPCGFCGGTDRRSGRTYIGVTEFCGYCHRDCLEMYQAARDLLAQVRAGTLAPAAIPLQLAEFEAAPGQAQAVWDYTWAHLGAALR